MKVLFQRIGDFLEAYGDDAKAVAKALGGVLVTRDDVPMAGIPLHRSEDDFKALRAAGIEPLYVDRADGLKAVWRRTHADFKGMVDGKRTVMVFRNGTTIVPLDDLRPHEIARLYPRSAQ